MRRARRLAGDARRLGRLGSALLLWIGLFLVSASAQTTPSQLVTPSALAYDAAGDLFIADANRHQVLEATLGGSLVLVAGTGVQGFSGDGGAATGAELNGPQGLAFGADGTLYIADTGNARVRAVRAGVITTFAGNGLSTFGGDGGSALTASFRAPGSLAVDATGALLVCDAMDHRVRRISGGMVSTLAGDGIQGFAGDGGAASAAELDSPGGLAVAGDGRVFIADTHNQRVRVVGTDGTITTFAGTGQRGFAGDGWPAGSSQFSAPRGLAAGPDGSLLIADSGNQRVRQISAAGVITTVAGSGVEGVGGDGSAATEELLRAPRAVALSSFGFPVVGDTLNGAVRVLTAGQTFQPAAFVGSRRTTVASAITGVQAYGQVSGSVAVSGAAGVPQGTVTLTEAGATIQTAVLKAGAATLSLPGLGAGSHVLNVSYTGDGLNAAGSSTVAVTVQPAQVTAVPGDETVTYGSPLPAFTGTVSGVLPQDTGQVSVNFGAGVSTLPAVGTYPITASLTGPKSGDYVLSAATGSLRIVQASSSAVLGSVSQSYVGLPLRLTARVASATGGQPTGTVQFLDGGSVIASAPLVNGSASGVYAAPPAGTRSLTVQYVGDANFKPSTSAVEQAIIADLPDFGLSAPVSNTATVAAGNAASYMVQVSSQAAPFTGVVMLSAGGLPAGATATFSPVQVVPGAASAAVTVSIQTPVAQALLHRGEQPGGVFAGFGVFLATFAVKRRRGVAGLAAVAVFLCGCGARTVGEGGGVVVSKTYTVQVTGTSTNLVGAVVTHSTALTLVVQQ